MWVVIESVREEDEVVGVAGVAVAAKPEGFSVLSDDLGWSLI